MKPWIFLLTALLAVPASSRAEELPVRIELRAPAAPLEPGKASRITIELLGENARPAAAPQEIRIDLAGIGGLAAKPQVTVPAGASRVEVPVRPAKPGLWKIEASSKGLISGFGVVVCMAKVQPASPPPLPPPPPTREDPSLRTRREAQPEPAPPPADDVAAFGEVPMAPSSIRPEPAETIVAGGQPSTIDAPRGRVELIARPAQVRRTRDGWQSLVDAYWLEDEVPARRHDQLDMDLVPERGNPVVTRKPFRILPGQFKSEDPVPVSATSVETAVVRALYERGRSNPVQIDFLSPTPAQLALAGASRSFRGLTGVTSDILVRLLDEGGQPVVADKEIPVEVAVEGPLGTRSYQAKVPAGAIQAKVSLDLNRPGSYTVQASAAGLKAADPVEVRFALDWLLIASSLLGGVLGSLTRVLYRREWPKGLARAAALGIAAALLVLLLSIFGVLSILGDALPAAKALEKVPATSLLGALLLGFIAGLAFDKVFGRFLSARGGGEAEPPGGKPAAKEAAA